MATPRSMRSVRLQRTRWNACWRALLLAVAAFCFGGAPAHADERARESLERVVETYAEIRLVGAELVNGTPPHTQRIQIVARRDGDYAARYRRDKAAAPGGRDASKKPDYYVFQSNGKYFSGTDVSQGYTELSLTSEPTDPRKAAAHQLLAPWPYVESWARLLLDAADTVYTSEGDHFTASSASIGLALTWNDSLHIVRTVVHRTDGVISTMVFGSFDTRTTPGFPSSAHLHVASSDAVDAHTTEVVSTYTQIRVNRPADEELLPFDPVALGVYRFDPGTGNVYNHDGSVRYNENAFLRQAGFPAAGTRIHTEWYVLLMLAGVGSGWLAYRQVAAGRLVGPGKHLLTCAIAGGRVLVGLFFLLAVVAKMSTITYIGGDPVHGMASFASVIERHGVIPSSLVPLAAYFAIALELGLGVALLAHRRVRLIASIALGFIALLSTYLGLVWMMRGNVSCGCLGTLTSDQLLSSLVRNLVTACLLAPSVIWKSR